MKIFLLGCFLFFSLSVASQTDTRYPFVHGEKITYSAYYNWHFLWIKSGEVKFEFSNSVERGQPIWQFRARGKTFKAYDILYKVRDQFISNCDTGSFAPIYFKREINHGKNYSSHSYSKVPDSQKIFSEIKRAKEPFFRDTLQNITGTYDLLAASYLTRTLDYEKFELQQKTEFKLLVDNEVHQSYYKYLGKEDVNTRNGRSFRCHKISIFLLESDFFPEGEYMKVWISDDDNRLPIMVETKITVGSVKAVLESYEGLKGEMTSEILN